jgi:large subunit ribosomal protein L23
MKGLNKFYLGHQSVNFYRNIFFIDFIKYPLVTEQAQGLEEQNQYTFIVSSEVKKWHIRVAIEYLFDLRVVSVNTSVQPIRKLRFGKVVGYKSQYKKAIVTVEDRKTIDFYSRFGPK